MPQRHQRRSVREPGHAHLLETDLLIGGTRNPKVKVASQPRTPRPGGILSRSWPLPQPCRQPPLQAADSGVHSGHRGAWQRASAPLASPLEFNRQDCPGAPFQEQWHGTESASDAQQVWERGPLQAGAGARVRRCGVFLAHLNPQQFSSRPLHKEKGRQSPCPWLSEGIVPATELAA